MIGAHPGEIQLLLGHSTSAMARRYTGSAAKRQGARLMPLYSPVSRESSLYRDSLISRKKFFVSALPSSLVLEALGENQEPWNSGK